MKNTFKNLYLQQNELKKIIAKKVCCYVDGLKNAYKLAFWANNFTTVILVIINKSGHSLEWPGKTVRARIEKQLEWQKMQHNNGRLETLK